SSRHPCAAGADSRRKKNARRSREATMRKHVLLLAVLSTMSACLLPALPARASLLTKAWVSNTGTDSLICGAITLPCATFQRAHDNVFAGGEIGVLTPGDYGQLAIIKSVNITNDGTGEASVLSGGIGISIGASAGDIIILRGLVIDGQVGGSIGISIGGSSAGTHPDWRSKEFEASGLWPGVGIQMNLGTNTQLFVSDSIIFNNGANAGSGGILIQPTGGGGNANVVLDRVHLENNVIGLIVDGAGGTGNGAHVVVRDSVVSGNFS